MCVFTDAGCRLWWYGISKRAGTLCFIAFAGSIFQDAHNTDCLTSHLLTSTELHFTEEANTCSRNLYSKYRFEIIHKTFLYQSCQMPQFKNKKKVIQLDKSILWAKSRQVSFERRELRADQITVPNPQCHLDGARQLLQETGKPKSNKRPYTHTQHNTTQCDNEEMIKSSIKLNEWEGAQLEKPDPEQSGRDEMMQGLNKMLFIRPLLEKASSSWACLLVCNLNYPLTHFRLGRFISCAHLAQPEEGRSVHGLRARLIKWVSSDALEAKGYFIQKAYSDACFCWPTLRL